MANAPTQPASLKRRLDCSTSKRSAARLGVAGGQSSGCVSGLVQGLTAYSTMLETLSGLLGPAPRTAAQWVGFGRIDWQAAERHHFTLEGIGADWNSPGGGLTRVSETYGSHSFGSSQASQQWLLARWEAYLTPNLLAVTQGSTGRAILSSRPDTPSAFEQPLPHRQFLGPVAADRGGLSLRIDHRQSLALWPGQLSRRTPLSMGRRCLTGSATSCWSKPASSSTTMPMRSVSCATKPAPTSTPR